MRIRTILVSLAAAGAVSMGATAVTAAPAAASSPAATTVQASAEPAFTCPGNTVCLFSGDKLNGVPQQVDPSQFGKWVTTDVATGSGTKVHAGSAHNNTDWVNWYYSIQTKARICVNAGKRPDLNHTYGWLYVEVNKRHCKDLKIPTPLP
jgi:hypothetical protein